MSGREGVEARNHSRGPIELAWLALSSERLTALLTTVLALFAALSAFIPQGKEALAAAQYEDAVAVHELARWGLTDLFASSWFHALLVLLLANLLSLTIRATVKKPAPLPVGPPAGAPYRVELVAALPERAVESLRESLRARLGAPRNEWVEGSRVSMVFDTSPGGRSATMLAHFGLMAVVAGAALASTHPQDGRSVVHAILEVKDSATGTAGTFDMMSGEPWKFFRWPAQYVIRDFVPSRNSLGPAIRLERTLEGEPRPDDFWVFKNAPDGFDAKHRRGEVAIRAIRLALEPGPGEGVASSRGAVVLVFGMGMLVFGALAGRRPAGLLWVEVNGDRVVVTGVPRVGGDRAFEGRFGGWARVARSAVEE